MSSDARKAASAAYELVPEKVFRENMQKHIQAAQASLKIKGASGSVSRYKGLEIGM
jgi:predicted hydrolase (HD superfamily)